MTRLRRDYIQRLELKRFSESTIAGYVGVVARLGQFHGCSPLNLTTPRAQEEEEEEAEVEE